MERIIKAIEKECPTSLAYSWDNVGLLIGSRTHTAKKVLIALDVNKNSIDEAIKTGADVIVSHHPAIFSPLKRITDETAPTLMRLIRHGICVYSAHTNMDNAKNGINARLARLFELSDVQIIDPCEQDPECGLGRVGKLAQSVDLYTLCETVKEKLSTPAVRVIGSESSKIERIAVLGGSCSEFIPKAVKMGAQAVITGDMKYHDSLDLSDAGITVIDAGHFPTEHLVVDYFKEIIDKIDGIETIICPENDVFKFM